MNPKYFICVLQNFYQNKMYKCNLIFANYYLSKMIGIRLSEISINFLKRLLKKSYQENEQCMGMD